MLYFSKIPRTQKTMNNEEEVMNIKISKISFLGEARVIGSINGTKVPDELNQKLKEELARADQPVNLGKLIMELSSET